MFYFAIQTSVHRINFMWTGFNHLFLIYNIVYVSFECVHGGDTKNIYIFLKSNINSCLLKSVSWFMNTHCTIINCMNIISIESWPQSAMQFIFLYLTEKKKTINIIYCAFSCNVFKSSRSLVVTVIWNLFQIQFLFWITLIQISQPD